MKKKKLFAMLPLLALFMTGCAAESNITLTSKEIPFKNLSDEYEVKAEKMTTYYVDGSELGYVNLKEYIETLDGMMDFDSYHFSKVPFRTIYSVYIKNSSYRYHIQFDYGEDTVSFNVISAFTGTCDTSETNYLSGIEETENYEMSGGGETTFDLNGYFNIYVKDGNLYLPFTLANSLFGPINYYNVYYNGDFYYGSYVDVEKDGFNGYYNLVHTSSLNNTTPSEELRKANYNQLMFMMNNYYGLKNINNVTDYRTIISEDIKNGLLSTDPDTYSAAYSKFVINVLDDPHSTYYTNSFYHDPSNKKTVNSADVTTRRKKLSADINELESLMVENGKATNDGAFSFKNAVTYYDDTAVILFSDFETGTDSQIYDENKNVKSDAGEYDSYYYMLSAMKDIESHGNIKNIMLDLTTSPGGNTAAMLRVLGFMTDKQVPLTEHIKFGNMYQTEYVNLDTDGDGSYTDNDSYSNYNWGVLTSNYTYSAANTFVSTVKTLGIAKVYGEKTGGGMCGILPIALLDGSTIFISGPFASSMKSGDSYTDIEYGISPDVSVSRDSLYKDSYIDSLFN